MEYMTINSCQDNCWQFEMALVSSPGWALTSSHMLYVYWLAVTYWNLIIFSFETT